MKKLLSLTCLTFGLIGLLGTGPLALAARPSAPASGNLPEQQNGQSGQIEYLDLGKGLIVINDREYVLSGAVSVNGKSGARHLLRNGMRIHFTVAQDKGNNVVTEITTGR